MSSSDATSVELPMYAFLAVSKHLLILGYLNVSLCDKTFNKFAANLCVYRIWLETYYTNCPVSVPAAYDDDLVGLVHVLGVLGPAACACISHNVDSRATNAPSA